MEAAIQIIGAIDEDAYADFTAKLAVLEQTKKKPARILVEIMSDGGSAMVALAFVSRMRLSSIVIDTLAIGRVASAATLILAAGAKRFITSEAWIMIHEDSADDLSGPVSELEKEVAQMRRQEDQWNSLLEYYSGDKVKKEIYDAMHAQGDTVLNAEEAVEWGFADEIV